MRLVMIEERTTLKAYGVPLIWTGFNEPLHRFSHLSVIFLKTFRRRAGGFFLDMKFNDGRIICPLLYEVEL